MIVRYQIEDQDGIYDVLSLEMRPKDYVVTAVTVLKNDELVRISKGFTLKSWTGTYDLNGEPIYTQDKVIQDNIVKTVPDLIATRAYCYKLA